MGMGQTVLPAPHPGEDQGSGHAKGFHTFVAALQLVCFQWKHDNSSSFVDSGDFKWKVEFPGFFLLELPPISLKTSPNKNKMSKILNPST